MTKLIKFLDLKKINRPYQKELLRTFKEFIDSGQYILSGNVREFESQFAQYCGVNYCVGVGNGLEALHLTLVAWGIGKGDEVIVPSNTYIATWLAVTCVGAKIVPVEPDPNTYNLDSNKLKIAITKNTKVVIAVHLYGLPANVKDILEICVPYGIKVLEDAAQAHGAKSNGMQVGGLGHAAAFSFYPSKNLGALGDAGAITSNDVDLIDKIRSIRNYGSTQKYFNDHCGYNSRLDELQAAFLSIKLKYLDKNNQTRREIANIYNNEMSEIKQIKLPDSFKYTDSVWHLYVMRVEQRMELIDFLAKQGVETLIHYPLPPHLQKAYKSLQLPKKSFPISESIHEEVLSLPIGPHLSMKDIKYICKIIKKFYSS
jgi:dTDP-4-amino-4,6-dideoxygalactose transaminase